MVKGKEICRDFIQEPKSPRGGSRMTNGRELSRPAVYEIVVKGNLEPRWSDWFDGLTITPQADDETLLAGPVVDQPALHGLLAKIRDLGLPLISVERLGGVIE
jgi:hypothetical protein